MAAVGARKVIIYGGKGALGSKCVEYFRSKNWVSRPQSCSTRAPELLNFNHRSYRRLTQLVINLHVASPNLLHD